LRQPRLIEHDHSAVFPLNGLYRHTFSIFKSTNVITLFRMRGDWTPQVFHFDGERVY
jgi:hypothetical protein